jgi:hypothetical protein
VIKYNLLSSKHNVSIKDLLIFGVYKMVGELVIFKKEIF